jgi:hypothetical protein
MDSRTLMALRVLTVANLLTAFADSKRANPSTDNAAFTDSRTSTVSRVLMELSLSRD